MVAILDTGTEQLANFESPCHPDASLQISAQPDLLYQRRCSLKNFKMAAILDIRTEQLILSDSEFPYHPNAYHQV